MKRMPTQELSNELKKRKGITSIKIEPYEKIEVGGIVVDGPAVILINQEYLKIVEWRKGWSFTKRDDPFCLLQLSFDVLGVKGRRGSRLSWWKA